MEKVIVSNNEIHEHCKTYWNNFLKISPHSYNEVFGEIDSEYVQFKNSSQKEVNYLVKEFECRKSADSYSRASISRTGVLDCSKLHTYRYSEDIFKKVTTLADGKNHGLIFILDWSGSMREVLMDTIKQLFNLIWFCKKVSIPFEVYAFTTSYPKVKYDANGRAIMPSPMYQKKEGMLHVSEKFSLLNIFTSKVNKKTLENQMRNVFRMANAFHPHTCNIYSHPTNLGLSGTPLNESLLSLHQIIPTFKSQNKLQKVHCVILTDGESDALFYDREIRYPSQEPYIGTGYLDSNFVLRDRKTGNTYRLNKCCDPVKFTEVLLQNLRDNFEEVNLIGIRIMKNIPQYFINHYCGFYGKEYDRVMNTWKKEKWFSIKNCGYSNYFGISSNSLKNDSEFVVSETATKSQIKSAFIKSLKAKKMNKKILGDFVELIV